MKKNKTQPKGRKAQEYKPWMLMNISPDIREMAKDSAAKHKVKVAEWVIHAILKTRQIEEGQTVDIEPFSGSIEDYPDKEFITNLFSGLRGKIEDLSKKVDETYKPKVNHKPWWKFWV
jgi:predicted HicB family RNase H-like nuclease